MTFLTLEMIKVVVAMIALTSCVLCLLTTGADYANVGVRKFGIRVFSNEETLEQIAGALQFLSLPLATIIAIYSWADAFKLETMKEWLSSNMGILIGAAGISFVAGGVSDVIVRNKGSRRSQFTFNLVWQTILEYYRTTMEFVRAEIAAFILVLPILAGAVLPYYSFSLSIDLLAIATFGILCYVTVFVVAMMVVKERYKKRKLYMDLGAVLSFVACGSMVVGENVWNAGSILNGSLQLIFSFGPAKRQRRMAAARISCQSRDAWRPVPPCFHFFRLQATSLRRLAIFAMVARLQPVTLWIDPQDWPPASMRAIPSLRPTSSGRPR